MTPRAAALMRIDTVGGATGLALLACIGTVVVAPIFSERSEMQQRRDTLVALETETASAVQTTHDTLEALRVAHEKATSLPLHLRGRQDLNSKIAGMIDRCAEHDLAVQSIVPNDPEPGERYTRTPIQLTVRGTIDALARYLHSVHETTPDLAIVSMEISRADDSQQVDTSIRADWITLTEQP